MPERRPSSTELKTLYRTAGSVPTVAAELGVAYETARQWLLEAGVELRPKGRPSARAASLEESVLVERYSAGESIATIGHDLGVSPTTVRKRLLDAGVALRPRPGWSR
jgi:DNA-directed RNA polymerase specialized sigma24 family protein